MYKGKRILAIIPARGGSKGIRKKNLAHVGDKTLLGHAIECVSTCCFIDGLCVSTDDPDIIKEAQNHGVFVPFVRPEVLSGDHVMALPVWQHAWQQFESSTKNFFDIAVWLQPTSPFRTAEDVERTVSAIADNDYDTAVTVSMLPGHYAPQKILTINQQGCVERYLSSAEGDLRQNNPSYYFRNGYCYAATRDAIFLGNDIFSKNCKAIIINRLTVNIDDLDDLIFANFLFEKNVL